MFTNSWRWSNALVSHSKPRSLFPSAKSLAGDKNLPRLLTSRDTIELATIEGARVAHLDSKIGTLTPGKEADIVMLATDRINVFPMNNVPGTVVTLMDTSNVENVFIAGRVMKWQGRLVGVDLSRIRRTIDTAREGLLARAKYFGSKMAASMPMPWSRPPEKVS